MRISVLVEDLPSQNGLEYEHGLSFAIETDSHLYLFDVGASDMFVRNASRLGISVVDVDALFLSHGHRDHTGGLEAFLRLNTTANVYGTKKIFAPYYSLRKSGIFENIGAAPLHLDPRWTKRFVFNSGLFQVNADLTLFADVKTNMLASEANSSLYMESKPCATKGDLNVCNGEISYVRDTFEHEQSLLLKTNNGLAVLVVGCSHRGIVNIMNRCIEILGRAPDVAIGGFHLMIPSRGETIPYDTLDGIARRLKEWNTVYYTGHCAGREAFERVKLIIGERISYFEVGDVFEF